MNGLILKAARFTRVDQWPLVGRTARNLGRFWNTCKYFEAGVEAVVDNEFRIRTSPLAFSGGTYAFDPKLVSVLKRLAQSGGEFLDVGAHLGIASLVYRQMSPAGTRIAAFEPNPNVFPLLVDNCRVNGSAIEAYRVALAEKIGQAELYINGKDPNASLSCEAPGKYWYWEGREKPKMEPCKTPVTTVDAICEALGLVPGVIKLDVEGAELRVLQGSLTTLERFRPVILMETHMFAWESFGYSAGELEHLIGDFGYEICNAHGEVHRGKIGDGPEKDNNHFVLRPRSR